VDALSAVSLCRPMNLFSLDTFYGNTWTRTSELVEG